MAFNPPHKILITSDDTLLEFKKVNIKNKNQKEDMYVYEYITSLSKRGVEVEFTEAIYYNSLIIISKYYDGSPKQTKSVESNLCDW